MDVQGPSKAIVFSLSGTKIKRGMLQTVFSPFEEPQEKANGSSPSQAGNNPSYSIFVFQFLFLFKTPEEKAKLLEVIVIVSEMVSATN